jgi:hypothetical protein
MLHSHASGSTLSSAGYDTKLAKLGSEPQQDCKPMTSSRSVHVLVHAPDVLLQVLADRGELVPGHADHAKLVDLGLRVRHRRFYMRRYSPCPGGAYRTSSDPPHQSVHHIISEGCTQAIWIAKLRTFLSDCDAPDPVQPVVYSP